MSTTAKGIMSVIASLTLARDLPDRSRVVGTFSVVHYGGNAHPHFSSTGELYLAHGTWSGAARQRNGREPDACGQISLADFPDMAPFVAVHLSAYPSGEPMHAEANGRYFIETGDYAAAARTLRCSVADLPAADRASVTAFVDAQRPRWAAEAAAAFALLGA